MERFNTIENQEQFNVLIKRSSDAPKKVKENPFYDEEFWGRALSPEDIYLPDSDEAISFAIAAHEIGHLSKIDEIPKEEITLDNFQKTLDEEERAWRIGKEYLFKDLEEYYKNEEEAEEMKSAIGEVEKAVMDLTLFSKEMYLPNGSLQGFSDGEKMRALELQREKFFSEKGDQFKEMVKELKKKKIGKKPDWDRFVNTVKQSLLEILKDNKRIQ